MASHVSGGCLPSSLPVQRREDVGDDRVLDGGNVCDDRAGKARQRVDDDTIGHVRGRRNDNDAGRLVTGVVLSAIRAGHPGLVGHVAQGPAGAHVGSQPQGGGGCVLEVDAHAPGTQREAKRCTHEARPNDENRADRRNHACANARRGPAHSPTAP